jgi:hypothetical protein
MLLAGIDRTLDDVGGDTGGWQTLDGGTPHVAWSCRQAAPIGYRIWAEELATMSIQIRWEDIYITGVSTMDEQHRHFVDHCLAVRGIRPVGSIIFTGSASAFALSSAAPRRTSN